MAVLILVALLFYLRLYFGVDFTDEAQYVETALLPLQGGRAYYNELFIQQSASWLYSPILQLYTHFVGYEGQFLFVRHLYFFASLGISGLAYRYARTRVARAPAAILAALLLSFIPVNLPSFSYNSLGYLGFTGFLLCGEIHRATGRGRWSFGAGLLAAIGLIAYPVFVPGYIIYVTLRFGGTKIRGNLLRGTATFVAGVFTVALPFSIFLVQVGADNLLESLRFSQSFAEAGSAWKLPGAFRLLRDGYNLAPRALVALAGAGFWTGLIERPRWLSVALFPIAVAVVIHAVLTGPEGVWVTHVIWIGIGFFTLGVGAGLAAASRGRRLFVAVATAAVTVSVIACYSSSMTLYAMVYPLPVLIFLITTEWWRRATAVTGIGSVFGKRAGAAVFAVIPLALMLLNYTWVYNDDEVSLLTVRVPAGPYRGLWTTPERARFIEVIARDIEEAREVGAKSILFFENFGGGYVMSDLRPATRSILLHPYPFSERVRPFYAQYYAWEENRPDVYFDFVGFSHSRGRFIPYRYFGDPVRAQLESSGEYEMVIDRKIYAIFVRRRLLPGSKSGP